jgi:glucose-1-phosphate cytidylyltransferase|tara:strand:+ start:1356 stop:2060 length:705 start_codon:yes stop_codon:yes gene_type:complete
MKLIILAGGFGTRLSEVTKTIPKPMVKIGGKPILIHIMEHYFKYGIRDFYIALGYKGHIIKKYFKKKINPNWNINLIETGKKTMTGGRLKRLKNLIGNKTFLMTYGDGVSNVNIKRLINFHKKTGKLVTLTAVRPPARFGALKIIGNKVKYFKEKSKLDEGWINGGFFVMEPKFIKLVNGDHSFLEKEPLEKACSMNQLSAFKHDGFWHCMDTKRDKDNLEKIFKKKNYKTYKK